MKVLAYADNVAILSRTKEGLRTSSYIRLSKTKLRFKIKM